ncbi:uncharacterized protein [Rhodnius prolixus]|uniref:uncharacterized protein n=1 Tax=Rhodnius prolixus TaxID=13249 RepID=UPI003D1889EE
MDYQLKNNDITILYNRREDIKREINNFNQFFDNLVKRHPKLVGILEIKARLISIQQYWSMFEEIQNEIELNHKTMGEQDGEKNNRANFERLYYETIANSVLFLEQLIAENPKLTQDKRFMFDVQLPGISLMKFSGNLAEWVIFLNSFKTLVHNNNALDEFKKLCYLKISLYGRAALMITDYKMNDYRKAWQILEEKYNEELLLLREQAKTLYELPKMEETTLDSLMKLWSTVKLFIEKLDSFEKNPSYADALLVPLIVAKFDQNTAKEWSENAINNNSLPTLKDVEDFLRECCNKIKFSSTNCLQIFGKNQNKCTQLAKVNNGNCDLCHREHLLADCVEFIQMPPKQRYNCVKNLSLCTNCLIKGHKSKACFNKCNCKICYHNHHTLLHFFDTNFTNQLNNPPTVYVYWAQQMNPMQKIIFTMEVIPRPLHAITYSNMHFFGDFLNIFLATARVHVTDHFNRTYYCRVFLNCGSHANFITGSLAETLFMKQGGSLIGTVQTISISASTINSYFKEEIKVLVTPEITNICVPAKAIDPDKLKIPKYIKMADPYYYQPSGFDILIGAEKFYDLLLPPKLPLKKGVELQDTLLGWIITGRIPEDAFANF